MLWFIVFGSGLTIELNNCCCCCLSPQYQILIHFHHRKMIIIIINFDVTVIVVATLLLPLPHLFLLVFDIIIVLVYHHRHHRHHLRDVKAVVCWLLNPVSATCKSIPGTDLLRQFDMLPHWDRSCRPNFPSHPVTVYWHGPTSSSTRHLMVVVLHDIGPREGWPLSLPGWAISVDLKWLPCQTSRFLREDFSRSSHTSDFKTWHSSVYPVRRLALEGQCWDRLALCQYTVSGPEIKCALGVLGVGACTIVWADPFLRYTGTLLGS